MCDYSLHGIASRQAREGESLVTHHFTTGSKGLTSPDSLKPLPPKSPSKGGLLMKASGVIRRAQLPRECAVCVPDGAELIVFGIPPLMREKHGLKDVELVTFRQVTFEAFQYRDALEFRNGVTIKLQQLPTELLCRVMRLPESVMTEAKEVFQSAL